MSAQSLIIVPKTILWGLVLNFVMTSFSFFKKKHLLFATLQQHLSLSAGTGKSKQVGP